MTKKQRQCATEKQTRRFNFHHRLTEILAANAKDCNDTGHKSWMLDRLAKSGTVESLVVCMREFGFEENWICRALIAAGTQEIGDPIDLNQIFSETRMFWVPVE